MSRRVTIRTTEESSPFQVWIETITCTKRLDGTFSLRCKRSGDGVTWPPGFTHLQTPEKFVRAYREILLDLGYGDEQSNLEIADDLCGPMEELDTDFAKRLRHYLCADPVKEI